MSIWHDAPPPPPSGTLRAAIERGADTIAAAVPVAQAIVEDNKVMSLRNLASRNRDRMDRIVARATALDQRGDAAEKSANDVFNAHETVFAAVEAQLKEVEAFNADMKSQLGNS